MDYYIYSLYDRIVGAYGQPMFDLKDKPTMIESYRRMIITQKDVEKLDSIKDLQLCFLGVFTDETGVFVSNGKPEVLCNLGQFIPVVKEVAPHASKEVQE